MANSLRRNNFLILIAYLYDNFIIVKNVGNIFIIEYLAIPERVLALPFVKIFKLFSFENYHSLDISVLEF